MNSTEETPLVVVEAPARKRFLGISWGRRNPPVPRAGTHLYAATLQPDGRWELRRIVDDAAWETDSTSEDMLLCSVALGSFPFSALFSKAVTDEHGHAWDVRFVGRLSVSDSRLFLSSFALGLASPGTPLFPAIVETWVVQRVASRVKDALREYSLVDLRDDQALPPSWWEKKLRVWLEDFGLSAQVRELVWSSAQAEAAEAEAARQRDLEGLVRARQREREVELGEIKARTEYEKQKQDLEADWKLSEQEREHRLQLLEKQRRKELILAETEIENARRDAERAALEHDATLARLRHDSQAAKTIQEREEEARQRHAEVMRELDGLTSTLQQLATLPGNLLAQLSDRNAARSNAAAERLVSPEFGLQAQALAGLGFQVERQGLVERFRQKTREDGAAVRVRKPELVTRDIGTARVKGLPVNTPLQFEFFTRQAGYALVLNLGTSGAVYIHAPNAFVSQEQARVYSGQTCRIPGPELLPWDDLLRLGLDYVEAGPPGWEHIAVVVSESPLAPAHVLARADATMPFVRLTSREVRDLFATLDNEPPGTWSAGVLSFLVE